MKLATFLAVGALAVSGCTQTTDPPTGEQLSARFPLAGLYTPGSQIGAVPLAGGEAPPPDEMDGPQLSQSEEQLQAAIQRASGSDKCRGSTGEPGTPGTLQIEFKSAAYGGKYTPRNCGVIWIEDASGAYIATPSIWARVRLMPLFFWNTARCSADQPDAVSSATLDDHNMLHTATWDGRDLKNNVVPDGMYVLNIEVTEDETAVGRLAQFPFTKGPMPETQMPADTESVHSLKMTYTPDPSAGGSAAGTTDDGSAADNTDDTPPPTSPAAPAGGQ